MGRLLFCLLAAATGQQIQDNSGGSSFVSWIADSEEYDEEHSSNFASQLGDGLHRPDGALATYNELDSDCQEIAFLNSTPYLQLSLNFSANVRHHPEIKAPIYRCSDMQIHAEQLATRVIHVGQGGYRYACFRKDAECTDEYNGWRQMANFDYKDPSGVLTWNAQSTLLAAIYANFDLKACGLIFRGTVDTTSLLTVDLGEMSHTFILESVVDAFELQEARFSAMSESFLNPVKEAPITFTNPHDGQPITRVVDFVRIPYGLLNLFAWDVSQGAEIIYFKRDEPGCGPDKCMTWPKRVSVYLGTLFKEWAGAVHSFLKCITSIGLFCGPGDHAGVDGHRFSDYRLSPSFYSAFLELAWPNIQEDVTELDSWVIAHGVKIAVQSGQWKDYSLLSYFANAMPLPFTADAMEFHEYVDDHMESIRIYLGINGLTDAEMANSGFVSEAYEAIVEQIFRWLVFGNEGQHSPVTWAESHEGWMTPATPMECCDSKYECQYKFIAGHSLGASLALVASMSFIEMYGIFFPTFAFDPPAVVSPDMNGLIEVTTLCNNIWIYQVFSTYIPFGSSWVSTVSFIDTGRDSIQIGRLWGKEIDHETHVHTRNRGCVWNEFDGTAPVPILHDGVTPCRILARFTWSGTVRLMRCIWLSPVTMFLGIWGFHILGFLPNYLHIDKLACWKLVDYMYHFVSPFKPSDGGMVPMNLFSTALFAYRLVLEGLYGVVSV